MRSPSDLHLDRLRQAYLGDPNDPGYRYRLNAFTLERMAQMHRAIVVGELLADGILFLARLPERLTHAFRVLVLRRRVVRAVARRFRPFLSAQAAQPRYRAESSSWRAW